MCMEQREGDCGIQQSRDYCVYVLKYVKLQPTFPSRAMCTTRRRNMLYLYRAAAILVSRRNIELCVTPAQLMQLCSARTIQGVRLSIA